MAPLHSENHPPFKCHQGVFTDLDYHGAVAKNDFEKALMMRIKIIKNMEQIIIEHLYKPKIEEIWNGTSPSVPLQKFGYDVVDHLHKGKIMFVGFNPSAPQDPPPARLFTKISGANNSLYPYLRPFKRLAEEIVGLECDYSYLDMLFVRCRNLNTIKKLLAKDNAFATFSSKQFELFKTLLEEACPYAIVVCGAFARQCFQNLFQMEFDENIGTFCIVNHKSLNCVPVFFTGMLTGKHALDKGSYKRLVWHIKRIVSGKLRNNSMPYTP